MPRPENLTATREWAVELADQETARTCAAVAEAAQAGRRADASMPSLIERRQPLAIPDAEILLDVLAVVEKHQERGRPLPLILAALEYSARLVRLDVEEPLSDLVENLDA